MGSLIQIQVLDDLNMKMHLVLNVKQWQIHDMLKGGGGGGGGKGGDLRDALRFPVGAQGSKPLEVRSFCNKVLSYFSYTS